MKKLLALLFAACAFAAPAQDIPNHSVPIGGGAGVIGWKSAAPGTAGWALISNGPTLDPTFQAPNIPITCSSLPALTGDVTSSAGSCATAYTVTVPVAKGGTGITSGTSGGVLSFTASGTIASSGALAANRLVFGGGAGVAPSTGLALGTTTQVLHGNAAGLPTWGAVSLTADVSGTLPVTNGGTGIASGTAFGLPYFASTTTIASTVAGTSTTVLHGNAAGAPTWGAVNLVSDVTNVLPIANGGTNCSVASGTCIDNISGFSSTGFVNRTGAGTYTFSSASQVLINICSTQGNILYYDGASWVCLAVGTVGQLLSTNGAAANPSWITATGTGTVTSLAPGTGITLNPSPITATGTIALTVPVVVSSGGTGNTTLTANGVMLGNGTSATAVVGPSATTGACLASAGSGSAPTFVAGCAVLLNTLTASASASLSDTTSFTSTYSRYLIVFSNILNATGSTTCRLRVNSAGVQTTSYVGTVIYGTSIFVVDSPTTYIPCSGTSRLANSGAGLVGTLQMWGPSGTSAPKMVQGTLGASADAYVVTSSWTGGNGAVTGIEITSSSGNITSGTVKIYGIP